MAEKKTEEVREAKIVEVTTQTAPVIELGDGTQVDVQQAIVIIINKLSKLEKVLL